MRYDAGGALVVVPSDGGETQLRRVFVGTVWQGTQGEKAMTETFLNSFQNVMQGTPFWREHGFKIGDDQGYVRGVVTSTGGQPLPFCWSPTALLCDETGTYGLLMDPGPQTLTFLAKGYKPATRTVNVPNDLGTATCNVMLQAAELMTVSGSVWDNDHLVISRVAGSRIDPLTGFSQEYVEVFNPTTFTWTMSGLVGLRYATTGAAQSIQVDYVGVTISTGGFFLFANTTTVRINNTPVTADAVWHTGGSNAANFPNFVSQGSIIGVNSDIVGGVGGLELYQGATILDRVGWRSGGMPTLCEAPPMADITGTGLAPDQDFFRCASTAGVSGTWGPAYDSGKNSVDGEWVVSSLLPPRNTAFTTATVVAGTPAVNAKVRVVGDPASKIVLSSLTGDIRPRAAFSLTNVTKGAGVLLGFLGQKSGREIVNFSTGTEMVSLFLRDTSCPYQSVYGRVTDQSLVPLKDIPVVGFHPLSGYSVPDYALTDPAGNYSLVINSIDGETWKINPMNNLIPGSVPYYPTVLNQIPFVVGQTVGGYTSVPDVHLAGNSMISIDLDRDPSVSPIFFKDVVFASSQLFIAPNRLIGMVNGVGTFNLTVVNYEREFRGLSAGNFSLANNAPSPSNFSVTTTMGDIGHVVSAGTSKLIPMSASVKGQVRVNGELPDSSALIIALSLGFSVLASTALPYSPGPTLSLSGRRYFMASSELGGTYTLKVYPGSYNLYAWYSTPVPGGFSVTQRSALGVVVATGTVFTQNWDW